MRQTMLEVVRYDAPLQKAIVVSGWGTEADWFRNIATHPALEVRIGRERYAPRQRFLTPEEVDAELVDYARRHPWAIRLLPLLLGFNRDGSRRAFADSVRMVAFRPRRPSDADV